MEIAEKNTVLIVDDDSFNLKMLSRILQPQYITHLASDGETAVKMAEELLPDLILLDIVMPDMDGYQVFTALQSIDETAQIPVIFITGLSDSNSEKKGLEFGAVDYISKPFNDVIVKLRVNQQAKIINQMRTIERLSLIDHLTGLPNRRNFENRIVVEWGRAIRYRTPISLLMIDVDYFKRYNDTYGHQQGDVALRIVAQAISNSLRRATDYAARWAGEEFVALLPDTDIDGSLIIGEQVRDNVEAEEIYRNDGSLTKVTVSVGAYTFIPTPNCSLEKFISRADEALYLAKNTGRNKVCAYGIDKINYRS